MGRAARQLGGSLLLWSMAYNIVLPLLPLMAAGRGATPLQSGIVLGVGYLGAALFLLPLGRLADKRGRRTTIAAAWTLGGVGTALLAIPGSWLLLMPGAFLAFAGAGALPALAALAAESAPPEGMRRQISLIFAAAPGGLLVGSSIGGFVGDQWGMEAACLIAAAVTILAVATLWLAGPIEERQVDHRGASARATTGVLRPTRSPLMIGALAAVAGVGFILLTLPAGFMTQYLRDVVGLTLGKTGVTNGQLAVGQLLWSALFAYWPGDLGKVRVPGVGVTVGRGTLLAIAICLAANAAYGLLFVRGDLLWVIIALFLRGAHYTLQPLGMTLVSEVTGTESGLATRFSLMAILMGVATAAAPVLGGAAYQVYPALPFLTVTVSATLGTAVLGGLVLAARPGGKAQMRVD